MNARIPRRGRAVGVGAAGGRETGMELRPIGVGPGVARGGDSAPLAALDSGPERSTFTLCPRRATGGGDNSKGR